MNTRLQPARARLLNEIRHAVAQRVHLDRELEAEALIFAQVDQSIEDRFPVLVAGEVVVGDEEAADPGGVIGADDRLDVVGGAVARLAPLHVDDRAERALEWAAAPASKLGIVPHRLL